jgi:hypothetical protein
LHDPYQIIKRFFSLLFVGKINAGIVTTNEDVKNKNDLKVHLSNITLGVFSQNSFQIDILLHGATIEKFDKIWKRLKKNSILIVFLGFLKFCHFD